MAWQGNGVRLSDVELTVVIMALSDYAENIDDVLYQAVANDALRHLSTIRDKNAAKQG